MSSGKSAKIKAVVNALFLSQKHEKKDKFTFGISKRKHIVE